MRRPDGLGFFANSFANLLVGAAALGYAVIVPAVVVRRFGADEYGLWYLGFQDAAYVLLLDLGSQYVVTNEAATTSGDSGAAQVATAAMLTQSGLAVVVLSVATSWAAFTGQGHLARFVAILGAAATASLLASTVRAWFGGLQRSHVPAVWLVVARAGALAGMALAIVVNADLTALTVAVAVPQLLVHAGLLLWARRAPSPWARPHRETFVRLFRSTSPLALWTVAGVFIAGVDIFVVRAVDPSEVGRFAIALSLLAIPTGLVTAAITAWMPRVARIDADGSVAGRDTTLAATTVMAAALSIGAIPFVAFAGDIVRLWAGPGQWNAAATYLRLLYVASAIRFVFLPWSILIVVRGDQSRITAAPLSEAAVNLLASIVLGLWLGATGVALGTAAGALTALVIYLRWAVPRTSTSGVTPKGIALAVFAAWPVIASASVVAALGLFHGPVAWRGIAAATGLAVDLWWVLNRRRAGASVVPLASS